MRELCAPLMVDLVELRRRTWFIDPVALSAYMALLDFLWRHGSLPVEEHDLADACRMTVYVFSRRKTQLSRLFDCDSEGRWHNAQLERRRAETLAARGQNDGAELPE